jgi:hypothetical protein
VTSLTRIKTFSSRLQPYFDILNIVVQSHPEWAAIAWGAIRLVLQVSERNFRTGPDLGDCDLLLIILKLASNFISFFDKLGEILEYLGDLLPHYAEIMEIGKHHVSERFRVSLRNLYLDLFDFFKAVARVFTQKGGSK